MLAGCVAGEAETKILGQAGDVRDDAQWFKMSKIRQNISSPKVTSLVFPWKFRQIHITSVSGCLHIQNLSNRCRHKYDSSISRTFWISFLAGFCNMTQLCDEGEEEPSRLTWFLLAGFEGKRGGREGASVRCTRQVQPSRERGRTLSEWRRTSSLWERQPNGRLHYYYRGSAADPLEKKEAGCARPAN